MLAATAEPTRVKKSHNRWLSRKRKRQFFLSLMLPARSPTERESHMAIPHSRSWTGSTGWRNKIVGQFDIVGLWPWLHGVGQTGSGGILILRGDLDVSSFQRLALLGFGLRQ